MKFSFLFLFAISVMSIGCNSKKQVNKNTSVETAVSDSIVEEIPVVISFEQTACFGTCPVHKMIIYKDGSAFYAAERHTKLIGAFTYQFTNEEVKIMLTKAKDLEFFDSETEYLSPITDLPTTTIYIQYGAHQHQVKAYSNYPENIKELLKYYYDLTQNTKWIKATVK